MERFAGTATVRYWEEPIYARNEAAPALRVTQCGSGVQVLTPILREEDDRAGDRETLVRLLDEAVAGQRGPLVRWYYTPMMYPFSAHIPAVSTVYDCMDELSTFKNAPAEMALREARLLDAADLVFTGGYSLYEAKRTRHRSVHAFPSSVDVAHFRTARRPGATPSDQTCLPAPRLGFYGVIDERIDLRLLEVLADARPDWSIVMIGPVVKIDHDTLPSRPNLHFMGARSYDHLPDYLRGWDVALMPFASNEATRFISPTKTPEYLAGGRPVVSTAITDVARHYGACPAVRIAADHMEFIRCCDEALALGRTPQAWLTDVDRLLSESSWDATYAAMVALIRDVVTPGVAGVPGMRRTTRSDRSLAPLAAGADDGAMPLRARP